jgi:ketosteroid isomerase-like protein
VTLSYSDHGALHDVVHRYAAGIDDRQFDAVSALFTPDAELLLPEPPDSLSPVRRHHGRNAIRAAIATVAAVLRTEHATVGEVYDVGSRPGIAHGRITCVAHHWTQRADDFTDVVWHLRYDDEYRLTGEGWRFRRRALTINAIETRPARRIRPRDHD